MSKAARIVPFLAVLAILVGGVATADGLLEPGRADRAGITLTPTVTAANAGAPGDWYPLNGVEFETGAESARLRPVGPGLQLISRGLPVIAGDCYRIGLDFDADSVGLELRLLDETGDDELAREPLIAPNTEVALRAPEPRLSIGLATRAGVDAFTLGPTRIERLTSCPANALLDADQG